MRAREKEREGERQKKRAQMSNINVNIIRYISRYICAYISTWMNMSVFNKEKIKKEDKCMKRESLFAFYRIYLKAE